MSLPHALLTALVERPASGLDLARRFDRSIGYFWQATHQQIYKELGRLEAAGWVSSEAEEGSRGRKRQYFVRDSGREELRRWLGEPGVPLQLRAPLMVKLRAQAALGGVELSADLEGQLAAHRQKLAEYQQIEARDFATDSSDARRLQHLILKAGILHESAWAAICEEALLLLGSERSH